MKRAQFTPVSMPSQLGQQPDSTRCHHGTGMSSAQTLLHRLSVELLLSNPDLRLVQVLASVLLEALSQHTVGVLGDASLADSLSAAVSNKRDVISAILDGDGENGTVGIGERESISSVVMNDVPSCLQWGTDEEHPDSPSLATHMVASGNVSDAELDGGDFEEGEELSVADCTDETDNALARTWEEQLKGDPVRVFITNPTTSDVSYYFVCHRCNLTFIWRRHLERHFEEHRTPARTHLCHVCGKTFTRPDHLNRHSSTHRLKIHLCQLCGKTFQQALQLDVHWKKEHGQAKKSQLAKVEQLAESSQPSNRPENNSSFRKLALNSSQHLPKVRLPAESSEGARMEGGGFMDDNAQFVQVHFVRHDGNGDFVNVEPTLGETSAVLTRLVRKRSSEMLTTPRSPSKDKPQPRLSASPVKSLQKSATSPSKLSKVTAAISMPLPRPLKSARKTHQCHICSRSFDKQALLLRHIRIHSGERPYVCPLCSRAYTRCDYLRSHILSVHDENRVECKACKKHFPRISKLRDHHCSSTLGGKLRTWYMQTVFLDINVDASTLRDNNSFTVESSDPIPAEMEIADVQEQGDVETNGFSAGGGGFRTPEDGINLEDIMVNPAG